MHAYENLFASIQFAIEILNSKHTLLKISKHRWLIGPKNYLKTQKIACTYSRKHIK